MLVREAYILAGPTASGKSSIAAALAREMGARILSADSMLVYKGMDIGTAKPSQAEIAEFGMGGVDLVAPTEEFSAGAWLRAASAWAALVPAETPIVIVGGTGLYFSALLRGLDRRWEKPPPEYPVISIDRAEVRRRIADRLEAMYAAGIAYATGQIIDLFANGVTHVHVYSMNKPDVAGAIYQNVHAILGKPSLGSFQM